MSTGIQLVHANEMKSLQAWGIERGSRLRLTGDGSDGLSFTVKGGSFAPSQFTPLAPVEIVDRDGVRRFLGVLTQPRRTAIGREIVWEYRCAGPDYWLRGRQATQPWKMITTELVPPTPTFSDVPFAVTRLGKDQTPQTIAALVDIVADAGGLISLDGTYVPGDGENADEAQHAPEDSQSGLTCLGAIEALRGYHPYCGRRYDYEGPVGGAARLQFYSTLRTGHGIGNLPETRFPVREVAASGDHGLEDLSAEALYDLLISKMTVQFRVPHRIVFTGSGVIAGQLREASHTVANGAFRQETFVIDLRPSFWNGTEYVEAEQPQLGLAKQLGAAYFHLAYRLGWREKRGVPVWSRQPGQLHNIVDADAALAEAYSPLRAVTYDLTTGETLSECDPGTQPGVATLRELLWKLKNRNAPSAEEAGSQQCGFEPEDGDTDGEGETIQILTYKRNQSTGARSAVRATIKASVVDAADPTDEISHYVATANGAKLAKVFGNLLDPS